MVLLIGRGSTRDARDFSAWIYPALVERVRHGGTDDEILKWCFQEGRRPGKDEIEVWNGFMVAYGWRDGSSKELAEVKRKRGFGDRDDIQSWFDFHGADKASDETHAG